MRQALLALTLVLCAAVLVPVTASAQPAPPPMTGFEQNGGEDWTTHEEELAFLAAVDEGSSRLDVLELDRTIEDRPIHLVRVAEPGPLGPADARARPTLLFTCSQHGNEPAGREACLMTLRDLAFTDDPALVDLLRSSEVLFVPTANPDGRAANDRENADGVDINRDHLALTTNEAQAIGRVVRDYQPESVVDLHEYGPSEPVLYDDDILYLWPRNLNVDLEVHDLAVELAEDFIAAGARDAGYSADEYGLQSAAGVDVTQTAGGPDEGIARNAGGLRHALGILVESAVSPRALDPGEQVDSAQNMNRRVASQRQVASDVLRFLDERGGEAAGVTAGSRQRKTDEGANRAAPVFTSGQYQDTTVDGSGSDEETIDPPPCSYDLDAEQTAAAATALEIHGIRTVPGSAGGVTVPMGQAAEPVIPLLLDERGNRHIVEGAPSEECVALPAEEPPAGATPTPSPSSTARPTSSPSPSASPSGSPTPSPSPAPSSSPSPSGSPAPDRVERRAGGDRIATAASVALASRSDASTVVLARADAYPDALAGGPLAVALDAPLLLTSSDALSAPAAEAIEELGATEAVLLGGEAALGPEVARDLEERGLTVRRIGGADRFATAGRIADRLRPYDLVLVAEGANADPTRGWPDALSASGLGAVSGAPVLLVTRDALPPATAARVDDQDEVLLVGGPAAVSDAVEQRLRDGAASVRRLSGATRYGTSAAAAREALARGASPRITWVATGTDYPDGLVAGAAAGADRGPLLLVDGGNAAGSPETREVVTEQRGAIESLRIAGGSAAVSQAVEDDLRAALQDGERER